MTTFTIDIPDNNTEEVMAQLQKLGVTIQQSSLAQLDELTKEGYEKHFSHRAEITKNNELKHLLRSIRIFDELSQNLYISKFK